MSEDYAWVPTEEHRARANVSRLIAAHGLDTIDELRDRSVADIGAFWDRVVDDLGIPFAEPYERTVDTSRGIAHAEWFVGGGLNVVDACLGRWRDDPDVADRDALRYETEDGTTSTVTYRELAAQVELAAAGLRALGVGPGDAVGLFMPMSPEAVVALYAIAHQGAMLVPLFSGYAAGAVAARLNDAGAKAVVTADGTVRRGKAIGMYGVLAQALEDCPTVEHVILVPHLDPGSAPDDPRVTLWPRLLESGEPGPPRETRAGDVLLLAYTSGTTGKPKGAVHTHAGFLLKVASEVAYSFDVGVGDVFCWVSDMGWIMGPLSTIGTHANGATLLLYDGAPTVPDLGRLWQLVDRHGVTMLGVSPTLVRALRGADEVTDAADLWSVRVVGSTGEPWDPDSYEWLARDVFGGRVPIINFSGGTEVGGSFLAPYPVEEIRSCSLGGPSLGMDVDVLDPEGEPVRGEVGELVCRQPWPSMTRGIWGDPERYLEAYWSTYPDIWTHGDWAVVHDGQWYLRGRSDEVMNVAGKRLGPAEVEAVLTAHPCVTEAAAVGVPDEAKGEAIWCFWVGDPGDAEDVSTQLAERVAAELGRPFTPSLVRRVPELPRTRSAKILRRAVRAAALGEDPGDLSSAENPGALEAIRTSVERSG